MPLLLASLRSYPSPDLSVAIGISQMLMIASVASAKPIFPQDQLCQPPQSVDVPSKVRAAPSLASAVGVSSIAPQAIISWLLDENPVRDSALDADGDGNTLIDEKILALTDDDYCASTSATCSAADKAALAKAREHLRAFAVQGGGPGYHIERSNQVGEAPPQDLEAIDLRDLLDPAGQTIQIFCVALPDLPEEAVEKDKPYWHENGDGGFRLSGDIDNLSKSRGSLGAVNAAELSITSDLIEDETSVSGERRGGLCLRCLRRR